MALLHVIDNVCYVCNVCFAEANSEKLSYVSPYLMNINSKSLIVININI